MSGHGSRKRHAAHEEEHENHERWLVSYADMMTLLMVLFIVMFAISQVDQRKFDQLKEGLSGSFGAPVQVADGGKAALEPDVNTAGLIDFGGAAAPAGDPQVQNAVQAKGRADAAAQRTRVEKEVAKLDEAKRKMLAALRKAGLEKSVEFRYDERGLVVTIVTDKVLFAADRAELAPVGVRVLDAVAPALRTLPNNVAVEGHTNTAPVKPKYYPSEWELSSMRAVSVVRHLIDADSVAAERLTASGYADQHPLVPGNGPRANRLNRRVEVIVLSALAPADRPLLKSVASSVHSDG